MAEVVAGLLVSAFVNIAKDKLLSAIKEKASLLLNFGDDLEEMKDHLETISAVLNDAERQSINEELVRLWLMRLKDAALDISDMLEDYQDTSDQANTKIPEVLSCLPVAYKKIRVANRMKSLREKLRKIKEDIAIFGVKKDSSTNNEQPYDERETMSYLPEEPVGRDGEKQEIINLLSANTINKEIVIVAIYGLGGMGKSTLAQLVYNDAQFKKYDYRLWVYVSQDFNLYKIGSSIISQLPTQGQQNMGTQQVMKQHLDKLLHGKTVLVVLDDLWEENVTELGKLRMMLHVKGSKVDVIVTTRKKDIAVEVSTGKPYKLKSLEDDKCWEIIKRSSKFELKSNQEKMEQVGLDIAKKCGGVALAAQAVGFMLRSINDLSGWTEINKSNIWNGSSKASDVLPSLKLSYKRMTPQLRICFSYCAIFPKGHNIIKDDLIQQWKALDFIQQSKGGEECIHKLLGMSFLQVSKLPSTSQEHVARYTMHDLVHDLARLTVADDLIVFDVAPQRNTRDHKYCRYSLLRKYDQTMKLENMPSKLRALRFSDSGDLDFPSGAFSFAKYLRTLDFSECSGIMLPPSIGRMKQLRCLIAPRMKNDSLPECITELSKLQYLNISGSSKISALPESIGNLGCLNHLCFSGCSGISKLPLSLCDLKCMVHLDMSGCSGLTELPDSLGNLTHLEHLELSGCLSIRALPQSLCGLTQLQYLNLSSCACLEGLPEGIGSLVDLKHLNMSYCERIRELPESLMKLQSLSHLNLSRCRGMRRRSLACLRGLTALQHLNMSDLGKSYDNSFATLTNLEHLDLSANVSLRFLPESIGNLTRLHTLDLSNCFLLKSLPESIGTLGLKSLVLDGCSDGVLDQASSLVHYSQTLPLFKVRADDAEGCSNLHLLEGVHVSELRIRCLENVRSLQEASKVKLSDKHNLLDLTLAWSIYKRAGERLGDKDLLEQLVPPRGLKSMRLEGYSSTSFPGWLMCIYGHLANLVSIQLHYMPACSNLPPLGQLPHLEKLLLSGMGGIRIDSEFCGGKGAFRRLLDFQVLNMECLEEWNTTYSVEDGVEELMFPVLDRLVIHRCPRLRLTPCPPTFRECIIHSSDKVISSLEKVDKTGHHCSSSSRAIKLDLRSEFCRSIEIFHHFPALRELTICARRDRTSMPESIRHLTSLESLTLSGGIPALPQWLGDLSSLKSLVIEGYSSIKSLPECIQQLTKLQTLQIRNNPELKKWCESEENKAKLDHTNVQFLDWAGRIITSEKASSVSAGHATKKRPR